MKRGQKNLWWDAGTPVTFRAVQPALPSPLAYEELFACYFFSGPLFPGFFFCCSLVSKAFCWDSSTLWGDSSSKTKHLPGPSLCRVMPWQTYAHSLCMWLWNCSLSLLVPSCHLPLICGIRSPVVPSYFAKQVPESSQHLTPLQTQHPGWWKWFMKPKITLPLVPATL